MDDGIATLIIAIGIVGIVVIISVIAKSRRGMKCIHCGGKTDYPTRRRNGGRCRKCGHRFAFEPRADPLKMTDSRFQSAIQTVSGDGAVFFTRKQLWYELNRRLRLPASSTNNSFDRFLSVYLQRTWTDWVKAHGEIEKLVQSPDRQSAHPRQGTEPDLTAYSFDRALVTDHAEIAAMLVANNFHFENNCAILSVHGYPQGIADTVLAMLKRNPQLKVFALHDASAEGCKLPLVLREERWFPDPAFRVIDLGLRPQHAKTMRLFTRPGRQQILTRREQTLSAEVRERLTGEEINWLEEGNIAEVEALRPAWLMRAIYQGFARSTQIETDAARDDREGRTAEDGGFIWIYDSGVDVYAADSFG